VTTIRVLRAPWAGRFGAALVAYVAITVLFFVVYSVAPSRRPRWDTALMAALFASLGFEVAKRLYGFYLAEFDLRPPDFQHQRDRAVALRAVGVCVGNDLPGGG
jgi:hypothetical protein